MLGSPFYYIIMIAALIALIILLCWMIKWRKHDERVIREYNQERENLRRQKKEEAEKQKTYYTTYNEREEYIPKYAAGCDMDRINRHYPSKPQDSIMVPILCVIVILAALVSPHLNGKNGMKYQEIQLQSAQQTGNIKIEAKSMTWSNDAKSLTIINAYTNESSSPCRNARTSFILLGENNTELQTYRGENLGTIPAFQTVELTTTIPLEIERSQIKQIIQKIEYFK